MEGVGESYLLSWPSFDFDTAVSYGSRVHLVSDSFPSGSSSSSLNSEISLARASSAVSSGLLKRSTSGPFPPPFPGAWRHGHLWDPPGGTTWGK